MSKKITHKEVEKAIDKHTWLTGKLAYWSGNNWSDLEEDHDFITNENIIIDYIKQQEEVIKKQQKLLELYKEALETNFEGITLIKLVNKTLRTQIKEIENER